MSLSFVLNKNWIYLHLCTKKKGGGNHLWNNRNNSTNLFFFFAAGENTGPLNHDKKRNSRDELENNIFCVGISVNRFILCQFNFFFLYFSIIFNFSFIKFHLIFVFHIILFIHSTSRKKHIFVWRKEKSNTKINEI